MLSSLYFFSSYLSPGFLQYVARQFYTLSLPPLPLKDGAICTTNKMHCNYIWRLQALSKLASSNTWKSKSSGCLGSHHLIEAPDELHGNVQERTWRWVAEDEPRSVREPEIGWAPRRVSEVGWGCAVENKGGLGLGELPRTKGDLSRTKRDLG